MDAIARRRELNKQSGFLSLPAEICNQIYGHVACNHYAKLTRRPKDENKVGSSEPNNTQYRHRRSLGLTQVCSQIHQEFLPLHLHSLRCSIQDMAPYMSTFYPYGTGLCGAIKLTMSDLRDKLCDFLPVLRLSSTGSNIIWEFRTSATFLNISPDMVHILNRGANKTWSNFLLHKVSKFEYCIGDAVSMKIVVKPSTKEEWMPWNPKVDDKKKVSENTRRDMARWEDLQWPGTSQRDATCAS